MAYLKSKIVNGHAYWYVVESKRVDGKVKTVHLEYLGKADHILERWRQGERPAERLRSYSHGGVAVLLSLAHELGLPQLIDQHAQAARGRPARRMLSVGQTLLAAAVGRALHPTSKRGWAGWAQGTSLGRLWDVDPTRITSQVFWDQMDRLPLDALPPLQAELGRRVLERFAVSGESLFYDTTNFYTFIDSRNQRCRLPQQNRNKQKRHDLRQFHMGLLVSRDGWVPLLAKLYPGNQNDVTTFPDMVQAIQDQCAQLGVDPAQATLVFDKGNVSRDNWWAVDGSRMGYVASWAPCQYPDWAYRAIEEFAPCQAPELGPVQCLRAQATVAGQERTLVVLDSPNLRQGQLRGLDQQLQPVMLGLARLAQSLRLATRRRRREAIERQIGRCLERHTVRQVVSWRVRERGDRAGFWRLEWGVDMDAYSHLRDRVYGRRVLVTNRGDWSTQDILGAYWGQSEAELVFRQMKNREFLALRPQYHWTDQKIQVHAFCCVTGYLLAALVRRAARALGYAEGLPGLLDLLASIRVAIRTESTGRRGRPRVRWQLEEAEPEAMRLYESLVHPRYALGPTSPDA